ncbi:MAG: glycosyltransferase family 39 protein [Betaproteobacteria bacterium]|nr:glycosyltransferase family 39 protein [Betaproteobacteria bacterium]
MPTPLRRAGPLSLLLILAVLLGAALRLYQFDSQILLDDEWHAVHQLIARRPAEILLSFGVADYCIPLTLLYWAEAASFGLSEFGMRWPMLLSGIAALILLPVYVWRTLGPRHAIPFAFLLAISPALVLYSRIARPYAVTLLLICVAHVAFERYWRGGPRQTVHGTLYGACAVLATWMHLIAGPLAVAPFLYHLVSLLREEPARRGARLRALLLLGVPTAAGMALLILPPLVADLSALGGKSGADTPSLDTLAGAWHWWIGTGSAALAAAMGLLAALGMPELWRRLPVARTLLLGIALTLALVLLLRPAWVQNPGTFGRYLLPVIPLLLLAAAAGAVRLADLAGRAPPAIARVLALAILAAPALALAAQSPLRDVYYHPNSNTTDPYFYFDFRPGRNPYPDAFDRYTPLSAFWSGLRASPTASLRIAVAPFYFEGFGWDGPRLERRSGQRAVPAWLTGFCIDERLGEAPRDARFRFRNAVFVGDDGDLARKKVDMIAFRKPFVVTMPGGRTVKRGVDTQQCEDALRARFGPPAYEDDMTVVFAVRHAQ